MHISIFLHIFIEKIFIRENMTNKFFSTSGARHAKIWLDNMRAPEGGDMNMKVIDLTHPAGHAGLSGDRAAPVFACKQL